METTSREPDTPARKPYLLCVSSGKGGTGKSFLTSNLVIRFSQAGLKTLVVDADLGMANLHLLLNIVPRTTLYQAVAMGTPIWEVAHRGPGGIWFLPGGSGIHELANLRPSELRFLISRLRQLRRGLDLIVVDTSAGIAHQTTAFLFAADMNLVVTTPDLTALTDAYAVIKTINRFHPAAATVLAPNRVQNEAEGEAIHARVSGITRKFLGFDLLSAGSIPEDGCVRDSMHRKRPVILSHPSSTPSIQIQRMAGRLARMIAERRTGEQVEETSPGITRTQQVVPGPLGRTETVGWTFPSRRVEATFRPR